jgi:hypothetical protein
MLVPYGRSDRDDVRAKGAAIAPPLVTHAAIAPMFVAHGSRTGANVFRAARA